MTPLPGERIFIWGTISNKQQISEDPKTQYITRRAPQTSDIHPPSARITPDGRVFTAASTPARNTVVEYTLT